MAALRTGPSFDLPMGVRASRSSNRPVLPGLQRRRHVYDYANGHVPANELCALTFAPGHHLRADAAVALARLNIAYRARFGHNLCLTDSYRTIASQESLAARKPGLAAVPGTSEHGMGLAVDFCAGVEKYRSVEYDWMRANAPAFGWDNPAWAIPPSSREEPWHWEYVVGEAKTRTTPRQRPERRPWQRSQPAGPWPPTSAGAGRSSCRRRPARAGRPARCPHRRGAGPSRPGWPVASSSACHETRSCSSG